MDSKIIGSKSYLWGYVKNAVYQKAPIMKLNEKSMMKRVRKKPIKQ